jgi:hypothetical protein
VPKLILKKHQAMDSEAFEEQGNSGASLTIPVQANNIKKNGHVVINVCPI